MSRSVYNYTWFEDFAFVYGLNIQIIGKLNKYDQKVKEVMPKYKTIYWGGVGARAESEILNWMAEKR